MEKEILKMISTYSKKISAIEILLNHVKVEIQQARRGKKDYMPERLEQARLFAQLASYHQTQADFDSLLDYI